MPSTRIKGRQLKFTIDGTDFYCDFTSVLLTSEEATDDSAVTFCDATSGGVQWYFETTAIQSTDATSLWRVIWDAYDSGTPANYEGIAFVYAPHGNATPSASQPHFTGTLDMTGRPSIGGEAGDGEFTFEYRFDVIGTPALVTA